MWENLIWDVASSCAPSLTVFLLLVLILDWLRSILFPIGR